MKRRIPQEIENCEECPFGTWVGVNMETLKCPQLKKETNNKTRTLSWFKKECPLKEVKKEKAPPIEEAAPIEEAPSEKLMKDKGETE